MCAMLKVHKSVIKSWRVNVHYLLKRRNHNHYLIKEKQLKQSISHAQFNRAHNSDALHEDIWYNIISYYISAFISIHILDSITTLLSLWNWISDSSGIDATLDANKNKEMIKVSSTFLRAAKSMISTLSTIN